MGKASRIGSLQRVSRSLSFTRNTNLGLTFRLPAIVRKTIPDIVKEDVEPFDFVLVTTKNIPDVRPTVADIIEPAILPGKTAIVLSQNGINIEREVVQRFPTNPVISSVSTIGATEKSHGYIVQDDTDEQKIGPFTSPGVDTAVAEEAARRYMDIYTASGKVQATFEPDVAKTRWRKLVYNASFNSVSTVLQMDTTRMKATVHVVDNLLKPIMLEIIAAARASGVVLDENLPDMFIHVDPESSYFHPSMMQDIEKGNLFEAEVIAGEPLRMGEALGVPMPTLKVVYGMLKALQCKVMEKKGMWEPKFTTDNPYRDR